MVMSGRLFAVAGVVLIAGLRRSSEPVVVASRLVLVVASSGLAATVLSVFLLRNAHRSLVVRAAYLDVVTDVIGSAAVVVSALATIVFNRLLADTVAAFLVVALIVPRAWSLLREALDVLLEATPRDVDIETVRRHVVECAGVKDVHDLYVWTITSSVK